jgi:hypothetical protein
MDPSVAQDTSAAAGIYRNLNKEVAPEQFPQPKRGDVPAVGVEPVRRGRPPKSLDNSALRQFAACFFDASDMTSTYPDTDSILSGVLALRSQGDSATRSLSRTTLFQIISRLDSITVGNVQALLGSRYAERTAQKYTEVARVASKALAVFVSNLSQVEAKQRHTSRLAEMQSLDAPYKVDAAEAEALCLRMPASRGLDTLVPLPADQRTPDALTRRGRGDA